MGNCTCSVTAPLSYQTCSQLLFFLSIFSEEDPDSSVARARHRQKRGLLKLYYGVGEEPGETPVNPCDINGAHFKPDAYMEKLLKEKSLTELMDKETDITKRKDFTPV